MVQTKPAWQQQGPHCFPSQMPQILLHVPVCCGENTCTCRQHDATAPEAPTYAHAPCTCRQHNATRSTYLCLVLWCLRLGCSMVGQHSQQARVSGMGGSALSQGWRCPVGGLACHGWGQSWLGACCAKCIPLGFGSASNNSPSQLYSPYQPHHNAPHHIVRLVEPHRIAPNHAALHHTTPHHTSNAPVTGHNHIASWDSCQGKIP